MQMLFKDSCVICQKDTLVFRKKTTVWGFMTTPECYACENCGSTFIEDELKWKLVQTRDRRNPIWQEFRQKSLYVREWLSIGNFDLEQNPYGAEVSVA